MASQLNEQKAIFLRPLVWVLCLFFEVACRAEKSKVIWVVRPSRADRHNVINMEFRGSFFVAHYGLAKSTSLALFYKQCSNISGSVTASSFFAGFIRASARSRNFWVQRIVLALARAYPFSVGRAVTSSSLPELISIKNHVLPSNFGATISAFFNSGSMLFWISGAPFAHIRGTPTFRFSHCVPSESALWNFKRGIAAEGPLGSELMISERLSPTTSLAFQES